MAEEQIRIDIEARDRASELLDDVADQVDDLEDARPKVEVTADTRSAAEDLGDLERQADELDRMTPEVEATVTATADVEPALRGIEDVSDEARELSKQDTEILLKAKIDDAKAQLKALRDDLDTTGRKAVDTAQDMDRIGGRGDLQTRGQAIADLTGPLGDASSAASDFAGVMDGIGDIAEDVAQRVGLQAGVMSSAIGGIGIAVAGAAALWTLFTQGQRAAEERQRKLIEGQRELNDLIAEGEFAEAAKQFEELYGPAIDKAREFGTTIQEATDYITGQRDTLPSYGEAIDQINQKYQDTGLDIATVNVARDNEIRKLGDLRGSLDQARQDYIDTNGTIREQDERSRALADSLRGTARDTDRAAKAQEQLERNAGRTKDTFDKMRGALDMNQTFLNFEADMAAAMEKARTESGNTEEDILNIKQSIIDVAEAAKLTPVEVRALLERVDQGDLDGVRADVAARWNQAKPGVDLALRNPSQADVDAMKAELRRRFGTLNIDFAPNYVTRNGQTYQGNR